MLLFRSAGDKTNPKSELKYSGFVKVPQVETATSYSGLADVISTGPGVVTRNAKIDVAMQGSRTKNYGPCLDSPQFPPLSRK